MTTRPEYEIQPALEQPYKQTSPEFLFDLLRVDKHYTGLDPVTAFEILLQTGSFCTVRGAVMRYNPRQPITAEQINTGITVRYFDGTNKKCRKCKLTNLLHVTGHEDEEGNQYRTICPHCWHETHQVGTPEAIQDA